MLEMGTKIADRILRSRSKRAWDPLHCSASQVQRLCSLPCRENRLLEFLRTLGHFRTTQGLLRTLCWRWEQKSRTKFCVLSPNVYETRHTAVPAGAACVTVMHLSLPRLASRFLRTFKHLYSETYRRHASFQSEYFSR